MSMDPPAAVIADTELLLARFVAPFLTTRDCFGIMMLVSKCVRDEAIKAIVFVEISHRADVEVVTRILAQCPQLLDVKILHNLEDPPKPGLGDCIAAALEKNTSLRSLDLQ